MLALTREQAREIDRIAMEELLIPGIVLMENAARGIADAAKAAYPAGSGPIAIVCGPGNNGGDGFAVARHLANAGLLVEIHMAAPPGAYGAGSDAAINLEIARRMGLEMREGVDPAGAGLVVDAIFGTGLTRQVRQPFRAAIEAINAAACAVVAVDVPSGLDSNTGAVLGAAVRAEVTATMVAPKVGFGLGAGPEHTGRIEVVDIGVPPAVVKRVAAG